MRQIQAEYDADTADVMRQIGYFISRGREFCRVDIVTAIADDPDGRLWNRSLTILRKLKDDGALVGRTVQPEEHGGSRYARTYYRATCESS